MLRKLDKYFPIEPIVEQVNSLKFDKRLALNASDGNLLCGPYYVLPEFQNTPLGNVLDQLGTFGEARLLKLGHGEAYTAHTDPDDRIHMAIITNKYAYLQDLDNEKMYHVPADGSVWYMDTSVNHVACNFGARDRIHLNIRIPLPPFTNPGTRLYFKGGDFDWKFELYNSFMGYLNWAFKQQLATGIEKVGERELLLNADQSVIDYIVKAATDAGFTVEVTRL